MNFFQTILITVVEMSRRLWDLLNGQLMSNIIGGLIAAILAWHFLQKRIENTVEHKTKITLLDSLRGDLAFDLWLAEELIKKSDDYLKKNKITFASYKTRGLEDFLYQKPVEISNGFYESLQVITNRVLDVDNRFLEQIRNGDLSNKTRVLENAKIVKKTLAVFIIQVDSVRFKLEHKSKRSILA